MGLRHRALQARGSLHDWLRRACLPAQSCLKGPCLRIGIQSCIIAGSLEQLACRTMLRVGSFTQTSGRSFLAPVTL